MGNILDTSSLDTNVPAQIKEYAFADHWLVYQPITNRVMILNETSRFICHQSENGVSSEGISQNLMELYDISYQRAVSDIAQCLNQWREFTSLTTHLSSPGMKAQQCAIFEIPLKSETGRFCFKHQFHIAGTTIQVMLDDQRLEQILLGITKHLKGEEMKKAETNINVRYIKGQHQITVNGLKLHTAASTDEALAKIFYELVESCYQQRNYALVLHAAAVAHKGSALVFAGAQGSGKSTLVAALQSHDFTYLTDDVCPIMDNRLMPVPMSQVLKQGSWEPLHSYRTELSRQLSYQRLGSPVRYLPPSEVCTEDWNKGWPVGALIFPCYRAEAGLQYFPISPIQALQVLINSGALFQEQIAQLLTWLETTPAYCLQYANLTQAIEGVREICKALTSRQQYSVNLETS